jgi:hypothetical protein
MAVVLNPALSMAASGNVGGICYSRWRGSAVARSAWTGTQTATAAQLVCRARTSTISKRWSQVLTSNQRAMWIASAPNYPAKNALGQIYKPTGYQLFMRLNMQLNEVGGPYLNQPPATPEIWIMREINCYKLTSPDGVMIDIDMRPPYTLPTYMQIFRAGPYDGAGRNPIDGEWRELWHSSTTRHCYDYTIVPNKYYWFKGRGVTGYGVAGNFHRRQFIWQ